jgi:hypothetical protein
MNEQDEPRDEQQAESVADLEVSSEQADDIQAGTSSIKVRATDRFGA